MPTSETRDASAALTAFAIEMADRAASLTVSTRVLSAETVNDNEASSERSWEADSESANDTVLTAFESTSSFATRAAVSTDRAWETTETAWLTTLAALAAALATERALAAATLTTLTACETTETACETALIAVESASSAATRAACSPETSCDRVNFLVSLVWTPGTTAPPALTAAVSALIRTSATGHLVGRDRDVRRRAAGEDREEAGQREDVEE